MLKARSRWSRDPRKRGNSDTRRRHQGTDLHLLDRNLRTLSRLEAPVRLTTFANRKTSREPGISGGAKMH
ncbi:hypothetical protein HA466_0182620 [Hirschfeldia incana]|nr:hypothetical protein HA466_0182620 [Hirschfeldia incana]